MKNERFVGPLIRILRLQNNWSQESLAKGICSISYLSKIEQGKAEINTQLLEDIFKRFGFTWQDDPQIAMLRDCLYEGIFSWDDAYTRSRAGILNEIWPEQAIGPYYVDLLVIKAYIQRDKSFIPDAFITCLDNRQRALYAILSDSHMEAYRIYPCPLTAFCVAEEAYMKGNYTQALEYLQIVCDQAAKEGYVYLQMYAEGYMANCYSDMGNLEVMYRHGSVAARLGRILAMEDFVRTINYNIAATKLEYADYEEGYRYFSELDNPDLMELHKLAVSCEGLRKVTEARAALEKAEKMDGTELEKEILALVRYRIDHPEYLHDPSYGELLLDTFEKIKRKLHTGYARFHLRWVTQWLTANRQYRKAFEILNDFPGYRL